MKFKLAKSAKLLKQQRRALLATYDEEELHQLRVTLRRIRSALESIPTPKARRLRRDLGRLAHATNAARDWDTLVACARSELTTSQLGVLEPGLCARRSAARDEVYQLLGSRRWKTVVRRWKKYSKKADFEGQGRAGTGPGLEKIVKRSNRAIRRALAKDDDKHWHQLRIAIKRLRYTLETMPEISQGSRAGQTVALCKRLQTELGDWHDTVVHQRLLDEFVDRAGHEAGSEADEALSQLLDTLALRRRRCLDNIKAELSCHTGGHDLTSGELLVADEGGAGSLSGNRGPAAGR